MKKSVFTFIFILIPCLAFSIEKDSVYRFSKDTTIYSLKDSIDFMYTRPGYFSMDWSNDEEGTILYTRKNSIINGIFRNVYETPIEAVKKENLKGWIVVAASTAILIYFDQDIIDASQQFGRFVGLSQDNNTYNLSPIKKVPLYVPTDISSGLYYIGDGITELGIAAGFYIYGGITDDLRAKRTAIELTEGIATVGIYIQVLKHITGRETPMRASEPRGVWRPFPTLKEYHSSVPKYDAYPSGHLATAMMTTTIISMNYPEYKFIKPLSFTLIALCGYQMMNNGVHWASDYPLALAMGYVIGKNAVNRGRTAIAKRSRNHLTNKPVPQLNIRPKLYGYEGAGISLSLDF